MKETSLLYKQILSDLAHYKEWRVQIGNDYYEDSYVSARVTRSLYSNNIIGGTFSASLDLILKDVESDSIPKMAQIKLSVRLVSPVLGASSEWIPKGTFWINTRTKNKADGTIEFQCVDAMMFGEQLFYGENDDIIWNNETMRTVAKMCAKRMGITLEDPLQFFNQAPYILTAPPIGWTIRQILSGIAVAHCGNIIVTENNQLRLVPLYSIPEETNYLINENGEAIMFGGDRILV